MKAAIDSVRRRSVEEACYMYVNTRLNPGDAIPRKLDEKQRGARISGPS